MFISNETVNAVSSTFEMYERATSTYDSAIATYQGVTEKLQSEVKHLRDKVAKYEALHKALNLHVQRLP